MEKLIFYKILCYIFVFLSLTGCSKENDSLTGQRQMEIHRSEETTQTEEPSAEEMPQTAKVQQEIPQATKFSKEAVLAYTAQMDWSKYFDGINGTAVSSACLILCLAVY